MSSEKNSSGEKRRISPENKYFILKFVDRNDDWAKADGAVWAQEFMKMFGHRKEEIDEDLMLCWFSNAIMCARDELLRNEKDIT